MGRYEAEAEKKNPFAIFYAPEFRKLQTVLIGVLLAAATQGLLPAAYATWVLLIVGVLTAAGVYQIPNANQTLELQPAGSPKVADVVVEVPAETYIDVVNPSEFRGDVRG